ncbi:hypothetical protein TanjilG_18824 [Lupinus angustifolius]|uniref:Uncharacterized protein n=1 Tax=Lupinus angustifolius TaxID=3871 RepID=A0A4P1RQS5_LUPAN|nr:hypothetical protein TanjilG_18824 [Lupinus angustifolius]
MHSHVLPSSPTMQPPHVPSSTIVEGSEASSPNSGGLDVDFEEMEKLIRLGFTINLIYYDLYLAT